MNEHATALARLHHLDEPTSTFARDVIDGLSRASSGSSGILA
jgi:hypothetical protein